MTLEIRDVSKNTRVASIASLESRVCPTDSIKFGDDGFPEVSSTCVGCGLCITRCPVHAIYFDEHKNHAQVLKTTEFYTKFYGNDQQFNEARNSLSQLFVNNSLEESILEVLPSMMKKVDELLQSSSGPKALQLLIRNAFLNFGFASRLSNAGDNNNWAELAVDNDEKLFAVEIENSTDGLDSARRVISDLAIACGRYGVSLNDLVPVIIMARLPNIRTDYYSVVQDADMRLGIKIFTVPVALIIWSIYIEDFDLIEFMFANCYLNVDNINNCKIPYLLGFKHDQLLAAALGLTTVK